MKIIIQTSEGKKIYQICKRNGKQYIRKAAVERWEKPTPEQYVVQRTFASAAMSQFGRSREQVLGTVKEKVSGLGVALKSTLNLTEMQIFRQHPEYLKQLLAIKEGHDAGQV